MIKLKEIVVKFLEGRCEREEGESDEDFIVRCGNQGWANHGGVKVNVNPNGTAMKTKRVIPIKRDNTTY